MKIRKSSRWSSYLLWVASVFAIVAKCEEKFEKTTDITSITEEIPVKESRGLFSPRMDYEQWKPLGRGDPLKNDPTYDYVPPVLDRVHYWIDPASRKPDAPNPDMQKTEILVLGVSSKKPSTSFSNNADNRKDVFDSFLKFVEGPNFSYQKIQRPQYSISQPYYPGGFYKNKPEQQKEPYTMLVPPPMPSSMQEINFQQPQMSSTSTTTPIPSSSQSTVSVEEANLVYQSSSLATADWKGSNTYATIAEASSQVTWRTPQQQNQLNNTLKTSQQLPTIRAPENFKEASSFLNVVMKPVTKLQNIKNMETEIIVSPEAQMHKGQVTDDTLDISSTYVSISKPDAQMQSATGLGIDLQQLVSKPPMKPIQQGMMNSPIMITNPMITPGHQIFRKPTKKFEMPITLQTMQTMQTMQPPPSTLHIPKKPLLHSLLKKEMTPTTTNIPPTTTSTSSLTTDPLFKHYKQPNEPLRGPLYLIIQGHSKVKTYGPSKQINGISVQETNEIPTSDDRQTEYPVKHLHELMKENREQWDREKRDSRSGRLQTLKHVLVTGLGAIDFAKEDASNRRNDDIKETEFVVKYDVSSGEDVTSEVYHKGIVESEDPPSRHQLRKQQQATL